MQNKGTIKFFAILLMAVSIFQLSFTLCTRQVEKDAKAYAMNEDVRAMAVEMADGDVFKEQFYLDSLYKTRETYYIDSMASEEIYNFLWLRKYTYRECKEKELNLGLDLKGGMNVTMEISIPDIVIALAGKNAKDPMFVSAMELASERYKKSQTDFLTLFNQAYKEVAPNGKLASIFSLNIDRVKTNSTNEEVINELREETNSAVERTYQILRTRIDRFGVAQPNIQLMSQSGRILIELPGIKEPERVRKLLQGTANLEFWRTYEFSEIHSVIEEADRKLAQIFSGLGGIEEDEELVAEDIEQGEDAEEVVEAEEAPQVAEVVEQDGEDLPIIDEEERYKKEHPLYYYLRPSYTQEGFAQSGPVVGISQSKDTSRVNHMFDMVRSTLPRDLRLVWSHKAIDDKAIFHQLIALKAVGDKGAVLTGDVITDARQDFSERGRSEIVMQMNATGTKSWKKITGENKGRAIAIVLDNLAYSFPVVQDEIPNGRSSITGNFTVEEAKDLANILKAGKLAAPARIVQEEIVGPTLGQESIDAGLLSFLLAFILVLIYMAFYYNRSGWVADLALILNIFFILGTLASIGAVLTLPGIAGIVLTLGMAVDANVIIFERIREEIRVGKGVRLAVEDGYKNAYSAIIDGNVTTLITGVILVIFGTGPIQGFATTLIIGILASMFSAILISRVVFEYMLGKNMKVNFDNKITRNVLTNTSFNFIDFRKKAYIISGVIIIIGIGSLFVRGLNYGIDFTGGRTYVVRVDQNVKSTDVREALAVSFGEAPEVKTFGPSNQVKVTTKYLIDQEGTEADSIVEMRLYEGMKEFFLTELSADDFSTNNEEVGVLSSQKVGPTVARDILISAIWAIVLSLLAMFTYIALRFKNWQFGLGAMAALSHDAFLVLALFSIFYGILPFTLEIDQAFIAAILTIIGYSINDTVVVFDRIRENRSLFPKRTNKENMNTAINSTLSRTINTSGTTLVVLISIFIFGGDVIRGFIFALLVGVLVGTYSSMFTASAVSYDFLRISEKRKNKKK